MNANFVKSLTGVGELNPYLKIFNKCGSLTGVGWGGTFIFPTTLVDSPSQVKPGVGETGCLRVLVLLLMLVPD